jgi:tRNA dimethylallyltransferase
VNKKTIHIIIGATASGKSSYALDYADKYSAEIINADSMQIYKEYPILSAQPTKEDQSKVPHHLYGFIDVQHEFNVNKWLETASKKIKDCWDRQVIPVLVGGTGFYIQAILEGLSLIPNIPNAERKNIKERLENEGIQNLYAELKGKDPSLYEILKPNDIQRICRALEVFEATGKPLSYWQSIPKKKLIEADFKIIEIRKDRKELYKNINDRVLNMIQNGAIDEVKNVYRMYPETVYPGQKILGYKEICNYLQGGWTLDQSIEKLQQHTRNYAKRQMTWFRHQVTPDIVV